MKNKILLLISLTLLSFVGLSQVPSNNDCANATPLTVDGPLLCNQNTNNATSQTGESCLSGAGGVTNRTVWYTFVATSSTMILNVLRNNNINCFGQISVYGPNVTCVPNAGSAVLNCLLMNGDPGVYQQLTGLMVGATYKVQYNGLDCGGSNDRFHNFCIGIYTPASNNTVNTPSIISECGQIFDGTTQGGYSPTGIGLRRANFDNLSTTCTACNSNDDVPWVANNDSWFSFCVSSTSIYNITFNVGSCIFSPPNSGAQMSILTGSPSAGFTNIGNSTNPTPSSSSWTSSNFTVNSGECIYLVVDGFAGDACNYSYVLNVVSGGCVVLTIELSSFTVKNLNNYNYVEWVTETEFNNDYFRLEKSSDGEKWIVLEKINGVGSTQLKQIYSYIDRDFYENINYYRLIQVDFDGTEYDKGIVSIDNSRNKPNIIIIYNTIGQVVSEEYVGLKIIYYSDGTTKITF